MAGDAEVEERARKLFAGPIAFLKSAPGLQFKLSPAPMDPVQQQVFAIMPWVMVVVMAPFASGLQLYWVTSNILTILQQWWLYKRYGLHFSDTHPATT